MRVDADIMKSLFQKTINNIVSLVKDVLIKPAAENVPLLLLVGGFAVTKQIDRGKWNCHVYLAGSVCFYSTFDRFKFSK
jgi:hypothetical protein